MPKKLELEGKVFGWLTVLKEDSEKRGYWICKCKCGNIKSIRGSHLTGNRIISCGCYATQRRKEAQKKYNQYDLSGEYGVGKINNSDIEFYFDLEDYDKIKDICWHIQNGGGYVYGDINGKSIGLHRLVMNAKEGEVVDHIYHNPLDNRKKNLRLCTQGENVLNKKFVPTVGVRQAKSGRWFAEITANKKYHWLGTYDTIEEAIAARKEGELKYFGKFRYQEKSEDSG